VFCTKVWLVSCVYDNIDDTKKIVEVVECKDKKSRVNDKHKL